LRTKKSYGNLSGEDYVEWLSRFGAMFKTWLKPGGSIVIELGNAWEPGRPTMSTLPMKALLAFQERNGLHLCQEFVCHNPARLPGPAQWVTVERVRVKDSFTRLWWLSASARPKADNRRVLQEYSGDMKRLLKSRRYSAGRRPSEHVIGRKSFLRNNQGAIPASVLTVANTGSNDAYHRHCKMNSMEPHPARMPGALAEFFIRFLTAKDDLVIDPFAGSNTTGAAAESLDRSWIAVEANADFLEGSHGRFSR
jgi:site-specific DNA-methyltransferase (cytosine-N4-specific)